MKQFATIIFVLIFALAGNSQSQDFSQNQICCNSISFTNGIPSNLNQIIIQDFYYDVQDNNDLDGFDAVSVLPGLNPIFQHSEIKKFAPVFPSQQLTQVGELLLDLPPPSLSV